jgi:hypothetical protein
MLHYPLHISDDYNQHRGRQRSRTWNKFVMQSSWGSRDSDYEDYCLLGSGAVTCPPNFTGSDPRLQQYSATQPYILSAVFITTEQLKVVNLAGIWGSVYLDGALLNRTCYHRSEDLVASFFRVWVLCSDPEDGGNKILWHCDSLSFNTASYFGRLDSTSIHHHR